MKKFIIGGIVVLALAGGLLVFIKTSEDRAKAYVAEVARTAYNEGMNKAHLNYNKEANEYLVREMGRISELQQQTYDRMANIRSETRVIKETIHNYPIEETAKTDPIIVEEWANGLTADLFENISKESAR